MEPISAGNKKFLTLTAHLLSTVRREVEDEDGEEADAHAGDDEVDGVEEGLPPHGDVEGDVEVGLVTAGVILDISKFEKILITRILFCLRSNVNNIQMQYSLEKII